MVIDIDGVSCGLGWGLKGPSETKGDGRNFSSPDRREHPPDFSSGDAEGWQEYGCLKMPERFAPKKTQTELICVLKFILWN